MIKWRGIAGFEGVYEVSSAGQVRRLTGGFNTAPGKLLKPRARAKGYLRVVLHDCGRRREASVHRLVALAFLPCQEPDAMEVNHLDGDPANNDVRNLEWCTAAENIRHSEHVLGRRVRGGERNGRARVTAGQVRDIRALQGATSCHVVGAQFGISKQAVTAIWRRETWKDVA